MGMKPTTQTREQKSQASPLADDLLKMIQGQISGGTFGQGLGSMTQGAGTAIQQLVNSGLSNTTPVVRDVGPAGADFGKMVAALEAVQNRRTGEQAANIREQAGAAGARYGTTLGAAESGFRRDTEQDFNVQLGNLAMGLDEARRADTALGVQRDVAQNQLVQQQQAQMLQSIMSMFGMGQANEAAGLGLAGQGILPEHLLVQQALGPQLLTALVQGLAGGASALAGK